MTELLADTQPLTAEPATIEKVAIVVSKGSLEGVYPALIMANGARMEGIEASLFFTFFGLDAIIDKRMDHLKVATVGNPAMHMPTVVGALPGIAAFATSMMKNGEAGYSAGPRIPQDDPRRGRRGLRLQGLSRHVPPEERGLLPGGGRCDFRGGVL